MDGVQMNSGMGIMESNMEASASGQSTFLLDLKYRCKLSIDSFIVSILTLSID